MNSSFNFEALLTALVLVSVIVLALRTGIKTRRRSLRVVLLAFAVLLAAVMLWNTAVTLIG